MSTALTQPSNFVIRLEYLLEIAGRNSYGGGKILGRMRRCGICENANIPYGVEWPWWFEGRPVHARCAVFTYVGK